MEVNYSDNLERGIEFKHFLFRKSFMNSSKYNLNVISYIEPINYEKIDKKKLKSREFVKMCGRKNDECVKSPPVCLYNPQNDSISKRLEEYRINKNKNKVNKSKIFSNFHQTLNYHLVKFKDHDSV